MKNVLIFGSSGSIGKNTLEIIRQDKNNFKVLGLLVNKNIKVLKKQIEEFMPRYVCVVDSTQAKIIKQHLPKGINFFFGSQGIKEFSHIRSDISVMGIVGISCLEPVLINMEKTKRIALASKEALVVGGHLVIEKAKKYHTEIIPIDSEINALFQLFKIIDKNFLKKVYLTASGGSLLDYPKSKFKYVTKKKVLRHPTWQMGNRITVDSATLVNKGFEVMESHYLFDLDYQCIDILIHRQSCIHALAESKDNIIFACLYAPDMRIPISFSLYYPQRIFPFKGLDFSFNNISLSFENLDYKDFPLLKVVIEAAKRGGNLPCVINAADEVAVEYFLNDRIRFYDIYRSVDHIFSITKKEKIAGLDDILFWDNWARFKAKGFLKSRE